MRIAYIYVSRSLCTHVVTKVDGEGRRGAGQREKEWWGSAGKGKGALFGRGSGNVLIATSSNAYKKKLFSSPLRHPRFSFLLTFKIPPFFFRLPSSSSPSFLFLGLFKVET